MIVTCPTCGEELNTGIYEEDGWYCFNKCGCPVPRDPLPTLRQIAVEEEGFETCHTLA